MPIDLDRCKTESRTILERLNETQLIQFAGFAVRIACARDMDGALMSELVIAPDTLEALRAICGIGK